MAHKELKRQYEEDSENHDRPWELWEILHDGMEWRTCTTSPSFSQWAEYRRKKPFFYPEYFSGLNYLEAEKLIGKKVGFSDNPYDGWRIGTLAGVRDKKYHFLSGTDGTHFDYIRTCPETYKHPTITIGGIELPKPELKAPEKNTKIWVWTPSEIIKGTWWNVFYDQKYQAAGTVHLTKFRAQAWADWWKETVIKELE